MADELTEDAPLTADEILRFGPVIEAVVWHPVFLQERRAPIAVAAGRPKLGRVFDDDGVGKAVVIRPCVSRGRMIRGLHPIYTPQMLEGAAGVFSGWPMYMDHLPPEVAAAAKRKGRSVKELGGQVLESAFDASFTHPEDGNYGYRPGGVLAEVWANPIVRKLVGNNPNALHTSINAWPTSGKPGTAPWNSAVKGMLIEGIRKQPQGSLDYVPRGGAGGRLLLAEGADADTVEWPEPAWEEQDQRLVVSLAESFYAAAPVEPNFAQMKPEELRAWVQENASHLLPALAEQDTGGNGGGNGGGAAAPAAGGLTEADVRRILAESQAGGTDRLEEAETQITDRVETMLAERDEQRGFESEAHRLIEAAENIPPTWKRDLKARYTMRSEGPPSTLIVESRQNDEGRTLSKLEVLRENVASDLTHTAELIAEAQGKPRVQGEGGARGDAGGDDTSRRVQESNSSGGSYGEWAVEMGLAEAEDAAYARLGEEKKPKKKTDTDGDGD